jgi:hypothetical protein
MNLIQTLPAPSQSNTRVLERRHDYDETYEIGVFYQTPQGRRFSASVIESDSFKAKHNRQMMSKSALTQVRQDIAAWLAVVNPIDNTVPAGFVEACEGPADPRRINFAGAYITGSGVLQASNLRIASPAKREVLSVHYFTAADGVKGAAGPNCKGPMYPKVLEELTICVITLKDGTSVTGASTRGQRQAHDHATLQLIY